MELLEQFEKARAESTNLAQKPSNESLLQLYSLYKQATLGDVQTDAPANPFDFVANGSPLQTFCCAKAGALPLPQL